jgi:hypothetical protein
MSCSVSLLIPSECVPALLGLGGVKVKDIQNKSSTQIQFLPHSDMLRLAVIVGQTDKNCNLAQRLIIHGVNHHFASLKAASPNRSMPNEEDTKLDVRIFYAETIRRKL